MFHTSVHICTYSRVTQLMLVAGRIQFDQQMFFWLQSTYAFNNVLSFVEFLFLIDKVELERNETSKRVKCQLNNY